MLLSFARTLASLATVAQLVNGHAFFHTGFVNGVSQGHLFGVRAPASNSPIEDVSSSAIACNSPLHSPVSSDVIEVSPGDQFGMQWNHNLAGATPGDADDPIAASHKGPVMAYMAKVNDASSDTGAGLKWFKVAEEGLDTKTGTWGVDTLIANKGLWSFTMPELSPGDYLLRGEVLALHSAGNVNGAQFYMSCVAIRVAGSGTCSPTETVSFPGAYQANDPGILISIYSGTGKPDNAGKPYAIPGPKVISCNKSSQPSASSTATSKSEVLSTSSSLTTINKAGTNSKPQTISAKQTSTMKTTDSSEPTTLKTITVSNSPRPEIANPWDNWPPVSSDSISSVDPTITSGPSQQYGSHPPAKPTKTDESSQDYSRPVITNIRHNTVAAASDMPTIGLTSPDPAGTADDAISTSAPSKDSTGYPFVGPGGKKFVCYEVVDS